MTEHVKRLYDILCAREYRKARNQETYEIDSEMVSFNSTQKSTHRLIRVLDREQPVLHPNDSIAMLLLSRGMTPEASGSVIGDLAI